MGVLLLLLPPLIIVIVMSFSPVRLQMERQQTDRQADRQQTEKSTLYRPTSDDSVSAAVVVSLQRRRRRRRRRHLEWELRRVSSVKKEERRGDEGVKRIKEEISVLSVSSRTQYVNGAAAAAAA